MAPISHSIVPLRFRDSFFRDPYFSDSWDTMERQKRQFDRDCEEAAARVFGKSSNSSSLLMDQHRPLSSLSTRDSSIADYFKSTAAGFPASSTTGLSSSETDFKTEKDHYKVILDVQQFKPEELCVKTSDDNNTIIIEGKHEEKQEGSSTSGYISRSFTRKYQLPSDVKLDSLQCNLSSDGVLQLTAPRTMKAITEGGAGSSSNTTMFDSSNAAARDQLFSSRQQKDTREAMTVDGRKIENADSKYDNYAKWKESRGEDPTDVLNGFENVMDSNNVGLGSSSTSKTTESRHVKMASSSLHDSNNSHHLNNSSSIRDGSNYKNMERLHDDHSGFLSSRMRNWDPFLHVLPDFDMVPFFKRRSFENNDRFLQLEKAMGIQDDSDFFKVLVDAKQFTPEELSVRCTDQFVVVEGKHEEKQDEYGYITRHFTRKYDLPKGIKAEDVQCNLSAAGVLEIKAMKPKAKAVEFEPIGRKVPISMNSLNNSINNGNKSSLLSSSLTSNGGGEKVHKISSSMSSSEEVRKESSSTSGGFTNVLPIQREQTRQESVESTTSTIGGTGASTSSAAANNRRVTIEELSRSSSANSAFNDHSSHGRIGEHVIPITISAK